MKTTHWYDYMWIWTITYFTLGLFNILFAWLGLLDFLLPLFFATVYGNKWFCNNFCGRGQMLNLIGKKLSPYCISPRWLASKGFRYIFLVFFILMFASIIYKTWSVAYGASSLVEAISLLMVIQLPWDCTPVAGQPLWVTQFGYGFYSLMLTSTIIGIVVMLMYKPRTWCAFCPMGTMTQKICQIKNK